MEDRKEKNAPWLSVPQFGDWDQKGQVPDYSLDFSKIRENRKQNKRDVSRASLGNEEELIASTTTTTTNTDASTTNSDDQHHHYHQGQHSPTNSVKSNKKIGHILGHWRRIPSKMTRRSFLSYFNCCVKA
ncbi:uncharacterized protein LOC115950740 isoform X1 [Quercus lobata]|uniref:RIN4 pathogenic type III effector avirulence factor Avr cleavage site domain-containing protein n=1 Tax=Quercus lobata TaxID=97700 RepID=A0A7N2LZJ2_QUELO|nr:uncharacterized protein LOC115950740 isoform X1 [Quercus lobata]